MKLEILKRSQEPTEEWNVNYTSWGKCVCTSIYLDSLQCQAYFSLVQACTLQTSTSHFTSVLTALFCSLLLAASFAPAGLFSLFLGDGAGCERGKKPQHNDAEVKPRNVPLQVGQQRKCSHIELCGKAGMKMKAPVYHPGCEAWQVCPVTAKSSLFLAPGSVLSQMGSATCWVTFWNWVMGLRLR